jgi:dienelactone hydrolase
LLGKASDIALETALGAAFGGKGSEAVTGGTLTEKQWAHPGTGPYPAKFFTGICNHRLDFIAYNVDPSLPEKTIYAPIVPPKDNIKMPVIVWGEGGCYKTGTFYQPYLTEIASHGYLVLANGPPVGGPPKSVTDVGKLLTLGQNKISDLQSSIDWALNGNGSKYGNIDTTRVAAGGQSCGGTEALSISYHNDLVKLTFLVNSGVLNPRARAWLKELKHPVAYFNGGPKDIAYKNVSFQSISLAVSEL